MVSRWLWPTKMPMKMASSHSKICDLVRGRKVGGMQQSQCQETRSFCEGRQKIVKTCQNRTLIGFCSKFASLGSIHIVMTPLKTKLWSRWAHCRIWLATIVREHWRRIGREGKGQKTYVTWCCWVVVFKKIWIKRVVQMQSLEHGIEADPWFLMISMCFVWFSWDIGSFP